MNRRMGLLAAGGLAVALVAGGGTALAAATGPVSGGVITGCYTNAAVNGSHALVLQDAGTACPKGTSAVTWGEQGPAGPAGATGAIGPAGPAGPAGAAGAPGATGAAGPAGANGNTVLSGAGAPVSVGNVGDFYIDTAADMLYGPKTSAGWPATGTSLIGSTGPAGPAGATGPQGPQGATGTASSLDSLNGTPCDNSTGTLQISYGTDGTASIVCSGTAEPLLVINIINDSGSTMTVWWTDDPYPFPGGVFQPAGVQTSSEEFIAQGTFVTIYVDNPAGTLTWGGACAGDASPDSCNVTMTADQSVYVNVLS